MRTTVLIACLLLAGCSSFKLGTMLYCPATQACALQTVPPVTPAPEGAKKPALERLRDAV